MNEVDEVFNEFWKPIIMKDGELDLEQLKLELYDYHVVMEEVSKVYDVITGGKFSKPNTASEHIIEAVEDHYWVYYEKYIMD